MSQAIAGVAPTTGAEVTVMTVWPSVAGMSLLGVPVGKIIGNLVNMQAGVYIFRLGNLLAIPCIPIALVLYFKRVGPFVGTRYRVTNKRVVVERGLSAQEERAIDFDKFDSIDIEVDPGHVWYDAGDLIFRNNGIERFRLEGVSRPQAFYQVCMKSHAAFNGVQQALAG